MKNKRTIRFEIRLSEEEYELFKQKASRYQTMSGMIRDAVRAFDDVQTQGKIASLTEIKNYYTRFDQRLGWLGGNINQAQHRANELAIAGELPADYFYKVLMPKTQEATQLIKNLKFALEVIQDKIEKP